MFAADIGAVTRIVPVGVVHIGWNITLAVGAARLGIMSTVKGVAVEIHPVVVLVVVTL